MTDSGRQRSHSISDEGNSSIQKYLWIVWEKKYWIMLITAVTGALWILFCTFFIAEKIAKHTTSTVIRFDDPRMRRASHAGDYDQMSNVSKVAVLKSNLFLEKPIDALRLNVVVHTPGVQRSRLIRDVFTGPEVKLGLYTVVRTAQGLELYYTNTEEHVADRLILRSEAADDPTYKFSWNGLDMLLKMDAFSRFPEIAFSCIPGRNAMEMLKRNLTTYLDRSQTLLTISYSHSDPEFSATATNTIARLFIEQLLEHRRFHTSSLIQSLEEQLNVAQKEYLNSEDELRQFREKNPYTFLADEGQRVLTELAEYEADLNDLSGNADDLKSLMERTGLSGSTEDRHYQYQELLTFLRTQNVTGALTLAEQHNPLIGELRRLQTENYSPEHPQVTNIKSQLQNLQGEIKTLANQRLLALESEENRIGENIRKNQGSLHRLPGSQLKLAELERNRQIKENIVSSIMIRYNEAKVADAAIIPEAFVIDEALPPLVGRSRLHRLIDKGKLYAPGLLLGLALSIGLFVALDYFNKTVKSARDVESVLGLPVLSAIPVISDAREKNRDVDLEHAYNAKLITSDFQPHIASESFRLLRTKLFMGDPAENRSYIVSSLRPGAGKSLVAANLAIAFALQKIPTLLIDCDLRRGDLNELFGCRREPGLTDILAGNSAYTLQENYKLRQRTHIPNLFLIAGGAERQNPSELLGGKKMKYLYHILKEEFNIVIFDTPPFELIPDTFILNNLAHGIILVVRHRKTNLNDLNEKILEFSNIKNDIAGVVINASNLVFAKKYGGYTYYKYGSSRK